GGDDIDGGDGPAAVRGARADRQRREPGRAAGPFSLRGASHRGHYRSDRYGEWKDPDAGSVPVRGQGRLARGDRGNLPELWQRAGIFRIAAAGSATSAFEPGHGSRTVLMPTLLLAAAFVALLLLVTAKLHAAGAWWAGLAGRRTEAELASLFVFIPARRLLGLAMAFAVIPASIAAMMGAPLPVMALVAIAALALPRLLSRLLAARWRRRLTQQLPDA